MIDRLNAPVAGTLFAALIVGAATLGGTLSHDEPVAQKADRFATVGDSLCDGQSWPKLSSECLAWVEGEAAPVRFVTLASRDAEAQTTVLHRVHEATELH
ncbi:hypothetical protein [Acuticoccus sp.]|uniref:hypothetical protein n=1 Tax=Acuticoccus sp. TaxID=1904378 RepID=UPI003B51D780